MPRVTIDNTCPRLDEVVRDVNDISSIPQVAIRVMEVANDPGSSAIDLKDAMESDPALCARVLRCVNSSAYTTRENVTNLQHAIAYLGLKQVRNLAITAVVSDFFKEDEAICHYRRANLWRHLVSVGICSRLIAMRSSFENFEDVFLAGLLHDIGIILEDQFVHQRFREVMHSAESGQSLARLERRYLGFDHMTFGEAVARKWKFPEAVCEAIGHHHSSAAYQGPETNVVRCVDAANLICTAKGLSSIGVKLVALSRDTFEGLSLDQRDITVLSEHVDQALEDNAHLLRI